MNANNKNGVFLLVSILVMALALYGCAAGTPAATQSSQPVASTAPAASASASATSAEKTFTAAQLAKYDGQNGNPAYVAVNGVVYDVSNVPQWQGGSHHGHTAGVDLTNAISQSPHGAAVLNNLPVVGKYIG